MSSEENDGSRTTSAARVQVPESEPLLSGNGCVKMGHSFAERSRLSVACSQHSRCAS